MDPALGRSTQGYPIEKLSDIIEDAPQDKSEVSCSRGPNLPSQLLKGKGIARTIISPLSSQMIFVS